MLLYIYLNKSALDTISNQSIIFDIITKFSLKWIINSTKKLTEYTNIFAKFYFMLKTLPIQFPNMFLLIEEICQIRKVVGSCHMQHI